MQSTLYYENVHNYSTVQKVKSLYPSLKLATFGISFVYVVCLYCDTKTQCL